MVLLVLPLFHVFGLNGALGQVAWHGATAATGPPIVAGGAVWSVDVGGGTLYGFDPTTGAQLAHITVGPVEVTTIDDYRSSINTHFWGPFFTTMAALPEMQRRREGRIVNISSIGGKISVPHLLPYSVGKFALTGFSEGLRSELLKDNIYITTVCPGLMRTGSPRNALFKGNNEAEYTWFSLSDALPLISMSPKRAARQIVTACQRGDAEVVLSLPAKVAVRFHGLAPATTANFLSLVNRMLPPPGGIGTGVRTGKQSFSDVSPSWLTTLNERAAQRNNEVA